MYWLDGGHSGGSNTWITSPAILKSFAALKHINIHIHVTPYQVSAYLFFFSKDPFSLVMNVNLSAYTYIFWMIIWSFKFLSQVQDENRPWIRKECKKFYDILRRIGAKVSYTLHFEDEPASLMSHFRILNEFTWDDISTGIIIIFMYDCMLQVVICIGDLG